MRGGELEIGSSRQSTTAAIALRPGWHCLHLRLTSNQRHGIRKRVTLRIGDSRETLEWNDRLHERLVFQLHEPATNMHCDWHHAQGTHRLRYSLRRIGRLRAAASALGAKVHLLRQFNCVGPVLQRGARLLVHGRFGEFRAKLMKGLPDRRSMTLEGKRASESAAAWWRRRTLPAERAISLRAQWDALDDPTPIGVIIPVDATRVDHARQSIFSVLRQIYPHWQLRILWPDSRPPRELADAIRREARPRICTANDGDLATAMQQALGEVPVDKVIVLSPDDELAEHALGLIATDDAATRATDVKHFAVSTPGRLATAISVLDWADALAAPANPKGEVVVQPLDAAQNVSFAIPAVPVTHSIHLSANFVGISGWDAVGFQFLRGLSSRGVLLKQHPAALVKPHVVPPAVTFAQTPREVNQPQLIVAAPFQLRPFAPDHCTAIFTMWECDRLAAADVAMLNRAA